MFVPWAIAAVLKNAISRLHPCRTQEAPDATEKWTLMGATDPAKANTNTLRCEFGKSIEKNATQGSDAPESAAFELGYFSEDWNCSSGRHQELSRIRPQGRAECPRPAV